jgi:hypothetical protein
MSDLIQLDSLPVETLAEMANEAAAACEASGRKTVEHAATCGRALLAIKAQLRHGEWGQWLEDNFHQTQKRAEQFMEIAKSNRGSILEDATSVRHALRLIAETPEKQAKKAEREAKKLEAPPKSLAPATPAPPVSSGVIRHQDAPNPQTQPQKPEWLADPDDLDRSEEADLPQLPRTNTHHTAANRRTPDARETDRVGIVPPDDPRTYHDGDWYEWSDPLNRMISVSEDDILAEADRIRQWRRGLAVVEPAVTTSPVVEPVKQSVSNKRFTPPTADEVSAYSDEINAGVDGQQFVDFYASKGWMIGKNKMKDWRAAVRTWKRSENQRGSKITTAVRSNRNWDEEIPEWKPTE